MLKNLLNLFYPLVCNGCQKMLNTNEISVCIACRHEIPLTNHLLQKDNEAYKKFNGRIPVEHVSAMLYYHKKGIAQQLIHNLKYKNQQEIGSFLGNWYAEDLKENEIIKTVNYIIPVPLHRKRLKQRGYNQVTTFCESISRALNIPFDETVLYRSEYAVTQSKKGLADRNLVSETTFDVIFNENHHSNHFLLIDDVLTTGATLEACGRALLKIPNAKISIVTIAFSHS
jgi:ComF family protein